MRLLWSTILTGNLPERTNNILTNMVPERVRPITTATYEAVDIDQEFTLSELEDVLRRLKDNVPGDDTVCYSMIKNTPLATRHLFLRLINQSFTMGRLPTRWKMTNIILIPKKDKGHRPITKYTLSLTLMIWQSMGGPIGDDILYKQMTIALKKIETKAIQLGLKFSPDKFEAIWYRSNHPDWNFKIVGEKIPWRATVKYLGVIIDKRLNFRKQVNYIIQKTDWKMNLLKVLNSLSDVNEL